MTPLAQSISTVVFVGWVSMFNPYGSLAHSSTKHKQVFNCRHEMVIINGNRTQVQILNDAVYILLCANAFGKGIDTSVFPFLS